MRLKSSRVKLFVTAAASTLAVWMFMSVDAATHSSQDHSSSWQSRSSSSSSPSSVVFGSSGKSKFLIGGATLPLSNEENDNDSSIDSGDNNNNNSNENENAGPIKIVDCIDAHTNTDASSNRSNGFVVNNRNIESSIRNDDATTASTTILVRKRDGRIEPLDSKKVCRL